jgi:ankyrin repeat protein
MSEISLVRSIEQGNLEEVEKLLKDGVNPDMPGDGDYADMYPMQQALSPFDFPPYDYSINMLKLLLKYGAGPNQHMELMEGAPTPLTLLLKLYDFDDVGLKEIGMDNLESSNKRFYDQFKLYNDAEKNYIEMYDKYLVNKVFREKVRLLLEYGADPFLKYARQAKDAFEMATELKTKNEQNANLLNILQEEYDQYNKNVESLNKDIKLIRAARDGDFKAVESLLDKDNVKNDRVLRAASYNGRVSVNA